MTFYWLYELPSGLFAAIVILFFAAFGIGGLILTRSWVRAIHKVDHSHNDIVGYFLAALTVFYGITLGLVAVGTWETYSAVSDKIDDEAQLVASLYRDVGGYVEPLRTELRQDLAHYLVNVVTVGWPLQKRGVVPTGSGVYLSDFQEHMMTYKGSSVSDEVMQSEVFRQYNALVQTRRGRLNAVNSGLPMPIWTLVVVGGLLCLATTWFFHTASFPMHLWMTVLMSGLLGLIVFMIGILDNPFRGRVSASSEPLELVYKQLMRTPSAPIQIKPAD